MPNSRLKKIKLQGTVYDIIPEKLQNNGYEAVLPTLTEDSTIALISDIPEGETNMNINDTTTTATTVGLSNIVVGDSTNGYTRYVPQSLQNNGHTASLPTLSADAIIATENYVDTAIEALPEPMVFKGSVGTSGTVEWANLPSAASSNDGFTYKVISDHSTTPICKVGDTIISNGSAWVVIPSGDEPSGTVTSVSAAGATGSHLSVNGGPITSSGTLTIGVDSGYAIPEEIPTITLSQWTQTNNVYSGTLSAADLAKVVDCPKYIKALFEEGNDQIEILFSQDAEPTNSVNNYPTYTAIYGQQGGSSGSLLLDIWRGLTLLYNTSSGDFKLYVNDIAFKTDIPTNYVPNTRKVNNKVLLSDVTLDASDIGALANSTKYGYSLSVNGTSLSLKDQDGTILSTITTQDTNTNDNQTIKGDGTAFGANDSVDIKGSGGISITADVTNKKITISSPSVSLTTTTGSEAVTIDSDSLNVMTRDTAQTISGAKTFSAEPILTNNTYLQGNKSSGTAYALIGMRSDGVVKVGNGSSTLMLDTGSIVIPSGNGTKSLGSNSYNWKDLYLSGIINPNSSTYGLSLPDTTSFTASKTLATTDQLPTLATLTNDRYIRYDINSQGLTNTQKENARTNIGAGTVGSVRVQAGTGLSSSVNTAQTSSLDTTIGIASGYKLPTTDEWAAKAALSDVHDATFTVQINGTSIGSGSANQSSNTTANIVTNSVYNASTNKVATMQDVTEAAAGKTATYVCSDVTNSSLNSQNATVSISSALTDINNNTISLSDLKIGDDVYIIETDVPDRWVSDITRSGDTVASITLSKLETAKVPVEDIKIGTGSATPTSIISNGVASLLTKTAYNASTNKIVTEADIPVSSVNGATGAVSIGSTTGLSYLTTAPTAANTSGLKIVVLSDEPSTKYSGYIYIITE